MIDERQTIRRTTTTGGSFDARLYLELRVWADTFAQIQRDRIALANRLRSDAVPRDVVADLIENYSRSEKMVGLAMRRSFRRAAPEVVAWLKTDATVGIGEHLLARLLGTIGHPVLAQPHHWEGEGADRVLVDDEPFKRNVAKLWAYCGVGDPARKRRVGMTAEDATALGNPRAKMLVRLIAEGCIKQVGSTKVGPESLAESSTDVEGVESIPRSTSVDQATDALDVLNTFPGEAAMGTQPIPSSPLPGNLSAGVVTSLPKSIEFAPTPAEPIDDAQMVAESRRSSRRRSPYRDVYDQARTLYATRDGWSLMHQHNAALRKVSKEVLKDLWLVSRAAQES